jgi:hypothetical protein
LIENEATRRLSTARGEVLAWLRQSPRNLSVGAAEGSGAGVDDGRIVDCFVGAIVGSGFDFSMVNLGSEEAPAYEVRWLHQGFSFIGFKQAPTAPTVEAAKLLACAALLQNDWCRGRLP